MDSSYGRMLLHFKSTKGLNTPMLYKYLKRSASENVLDTFLLVFHMRDCRGGQGKRNLARQSFVWLFLNYPHFFKKIIHLLHEFGRWDDLLIFWPGVLDLTDLDFIQANYYSTVNEGEKGLLFLQNLQLKIVKFMGNQLTNDLSNMKSGKLVSLCAKWAPTENNSIDRKYKVVDTLCSEMGWTKKHYRAHFLSPLRKHLNVVERDMCGKRWDDIDFDAVPVKAMKKLKSVFRKNTCTFTRWKATRPRLVNRQGRVYPHKIISKIRNKPSLYVKILKEWKTIEKNTEKMGNLKNSVCVIDVSGSMYNWNWSNKKCTGTNLFLPADVSIAFGILISKLIDGPFRNKIITFHSKPTFYSLREKDNIHKRHKDIQDIEWSGSTNIQATFDLILEKALRYKVNQEDMPRQIFIITDMKFDKAMLNNRNKPLNSKDVNTIDKKYKAGGYSRPRIIFWNICGSDEDFPTMTKNDQETVYISGISSLIVDILLTDKNFNPVAIMRHTLNSKRYKIISDSLKIDS